jgi:hypothetical protein
LEKEDIIIVNSENKRDYITQIRGCVDRENSVTITWEWPKNTFYNKCAIFEINEDESLEHLLEYKKPTIMEDSFDLKYRTKITGFSGQFKLFPVHIEKGGKITFVDQKVENVTGKFLRKLKLSYSLRYERSPFGKYKKVILQLLNLQEITQQPFLYYQSIGKDGKVIRYGIDLQRFQSGQYEFFVRKDDVIELLLTEDQKQFIELFRC